MHDKITKLVMLLILFLPFKSFSMSEVMFKAGLGVGVFVLITLLVVIVYVLNKIVTTKEIKK